MELCNPLPPTLRLVMTMYDRKDEDINRFDSVKDRIRKYFGKAVADVITNVPPMLE